MQLEVRKCVCGAEFKCLSSSPQQFHSKHCGEISGIGWKAIRTRRNRRRNGFEGESTAIPITSAITKDANVKVIPIGLRELESTKGCTKESGEKNTPSEPSRLVDNTKQEIRSPDVQEEEKREKLTLIEREDESSSEDCERSIPKSLEKDKLAGGTVKTPQRQSLAQQEISKVEVFQSRNLVDDSIKHLQELTKLSINTLTSQDHKHRDPQMVNAGVNAAKAITNLLRLKLDAAKMLK